jgi:hypothetical protein
MTNPVPLGANTINAGASSFLSSQPAPAKEIPVVQAQTYSETANAPSEPTEAAPVVPSAPEAPKSKPSPKKMADLAKAEYKLQQQTKEAKKLAEKAEAYKKAFASDNAAEALDALGLDKNKIFQSLLDEQLKQTTADPTSEKLTDHDKKLQSALDKIAQLENQIQEDKESTAATTVKSNYIAPLIHKDPDKYETLIDIFGSKEAVIDQVYSEIYDEYQKSGNSYQPEEALDAMENYWQGVVERSLNKAKSLKKYSKFFANQPEQLQTSMHPVSSTADRLSSALSALETSRPLETSGQTLTNKTSYPAQTQVYSATAIKPSANDTKLKQFMQRKGIQG